MLACTSARFGEPEQWHERAAIVRADGLEAIVDAVIDALVHARASPTSSRYRAMFLSIDAEGYARCCEALAGCGRRARRSDAIAAPTLVVAGADDPTSPPGARRADRRAASPARGSR